MGSIRQTRGYGGMVRMPSQDIYESSETKKQALGTRLPIGDREFVYTKNAGTALVPAALVCGDVEAANCNLLSVASTVINSDIVRVIMKTSCAKNKFADGYMWVESGTNLGTYRIKSHPANGSTSSMALTLYDELAAVLTNGVDFVCIDRCHNTSATVMPIAVGDIRPPIGVPLVSVAANHYFWAQNKGPAGVTYVSMAGAAAGSPGMPVIPASSDSGNLSVPTSGNLLDLYPIIGYLMHSTSALDENQTLVMLAIQ